MAKTENHDRLDTDNNREPTKKELQRQMEQTRESLSETVSEIKETVDHEVRAVKRTVTGVLDYREKFQEEPLVWSLGALSAGFALGYTMGYAHKHSKNGKQSAVAAFADSLVDELSTVGSAMVLPALDAKIKELFGVQFSELLTEMKQHPKTPAKKRTAKRKQAKATKKRVAAKK